MVIFFVSFLHNRCQRFVLNGQSSNSKFVKAGIQQGSLLGPLFFLLYINNLPQGLISDAKLLLMIFPYFRLLTVRKLLIQY